MSKREFRELMKDGSFKGRDLLCYPFDLNPIASQTFTFDLNPIASQSFPFDLNPIASQAFPFDLNPVASQTFHFDLRLYYNHWNIPPKMCVRRSKIP
ncbi:4337_t:CDS:2 [Cetraspora pellucida]|uniref:4337_t:CDS:1 n=1 Tax=Cetraspora pellucida TaxID=1433469 RepID=A0ACA9L1C4_9GLOM|nr:4337_t:CDS:2 [Cetraspora pellucida]